MDIRNFLKTKDGKPLIKSIDSTKSNDKSNDKTNKRKKNDDNDEENKNSSEIKSKPIIKKQKVIIEKKTFISSHQLKEKEIINVPLPRSNANELWVDKYKPKTKQDLVGNPTLFRDLEQWIQTWDQVHIHKTLNVSRNKKNPGAKAVLMSGSPGTGKCLGFGTKIIMSNGQLKEIQNIKKGDYVMGIDNQPKLVKDICKGVSPMYLVKQNQGNHYVVNEDHILTLKLNYVKKKNKNTYIEEKAYKKNDIVDISVKEYIKLSATKKHYLKGFKGILSFKFNKVILDPYILGIWLGDGSHAKTEITNTDPEVVNIWKQFAYDNDLYITKTKGITYTINRGTLDHKKINTFLEQLRELKLFKCGPGGKFIPKQYLYNDENVRLQLLAGILDTDGYLSQKSLGYEIIQKSEQLSNDIVYLCRSLGFRISIVETIKGYKTENKIFKALYYRMYITGDIWRIPCKVERRKCHKDDIKQNKNHLHTGIEVIPLPNNYYSDEEKYKFYYGFQLEGEDKHFLLGDFTVTHNSSSVACIAKGLGFEVFETNASEARSKKSIEKVLNVQIHNTSIQSMFNKNNNHNKMKINKKKLIIMDEVDGMSSSDRGGVAELIKIIKQSDIPIVCICNDRQKASIRSLANHCYDLKVNRPMPVSILKRMQYIAKQENLLVDDKSLEILINSTGNDIRQIVNTMQMWKVNASKITPQSLFENKKVINKDGVQRLTFMSASQFLFNTAGKSPFDLRYNAVFVDFDMISLVLGENYINANKTKSLDDLSKAADALCNVDILNTRIKGQQQWNLMPIAAAANVSVATYTKGFVGFPKFPEILGKISKTNKRIRMLGEISSHITANTTASTSSIRLEMMEPLRYFILSPLIEQGGNINETLNRMNMYGLTREDVFENMPELQIHDNSLMFKDIHKNIPSKIKGAFTREYNKRYQFKP